MKLFDEPFLPRKKLKEVCLATVLIIIAVYIISAICSYCGSSIFIMNYENAWTDKVEETLRNWGIYPMLQWAFSTVEFAIIDYFVNKKIGKWYVFSIYYLVPVILSIPFVIPSVLLTEFSLTMYILSILVNLKLEGELNFKNFLKQFGKLALAFCIALVFQFIIEVIKSGSFVPTNMILPLPATLIYLIEYDIALSITLFTLELYLDKEKGDDKLCTTYQQVGSSSMTQKKKSQKAKLKTKTKIKIVILFLVQILGFMFVMALPFLLGKPLEMLLMYFTFCVVRYILGFKYSLHYKKESICILVSVSVFGLFTVLVPFFTVNTIVGVLLGMGLAILLHLSYKYKSMWLFYPFAKSERMARLNVIFSGDLSEHHIKTLCKYWGLEDYKIAILIDYANQEKLSYISAKHKYSIRQINNLIDKSIDYLETRQ